MRLGPFRIAPSIGVSTGVDTNVFNDRIDPKEDWTTSVNPRANVWFRLGPIGAQVQHSSSFVNFREYSQQGGLGTTNTARLDLPLNRTALFAVQTFSSRFERPNIEIDARVRHREDVLQAGLDVRASGKTTLRLDATRSLHLFDDEAIFEGVNLASSLNSRVESGRLSLRHQATALTTFVLSGEATREHFAASEASFRNSESVRVSPGVELDPRALIGGRAYVGYRRFIITSGLAPRFTGVVASAELSSTIRGATRLTLQANRDVAYSYESTGAYYLQTGVAVTVTHRLGQNWDLTAQAGFQNLNYERWAFPTTIPPLVRALPPRFDTVENYRGGIGYRLGESMLLGVTYDFNRRTSTRDRRAFEGARILSVFSYGL